MERRTRLHQDCLNKYYGAREDRQKHIRTQECFMRDDPEYQGLLAIECGALMALLFHFPNERHLYHVKMHRLLEQIDDSIKLPPLPH